MYTILLLLVSNVFMNFAWYGHLKYMKSPLWMAVLASWGLAFFEYCFQVPANRIGYDAPDHPGAFSAAQLKIIQEVITLVVFCGVSVFYLNERLRWNHAAAFVCLVAAVFFVTRKT